MYFSPGGLTSEEVFLGIDEVVGGLIHFNLTLPWLRHVPYPRVAGYHMKLTKEKEILKQQIINLIVSSYIFTMEF